jgi:hypothetical protein
LSQSLRHHSVEVIGVRAEYLPAVVFFRRNLDLDVPSASCGVLAADAAAHPFRYLAPSIPAIPVGHSRSGRVTALARDAQPVVERHLTTIQDALNRTGIKQRR